MRLPVALPLVLLAALPAAARAAEWTRSVPGAERPEVVVRAGDAHVNVVTSERKDVSVHVVTRGWTIGRQVTVQARQTGRTIEVEAREPRFQIGFIFFMGNHRTDIEVAMPRDADLEVRTGDGGIEVDPVAGRVALETGDGRIVARGLKGDLSLHSRDGGIEATGLDGRLRASTADGSLRIVGRFDALELETSDGRIVAEAREGSALASPWSLRTGDGSVTLRLPPRLDADLDASTGDGGITLDLPVQIQGEFRRSHLQGRIGAGGPLIHVRTGDGPIRIETL